MRDGYKHLKTHSLEQVVVQTVAEAYIFIYEAYILKTGKFKNQVLPCLF